MTAFYTGRCLKSLDELELAIKKAEELRIISEDRFLEELGSFWLNIPPPCSLDPWDLDYAQHWQNIYRKISNREYNLSNEFYDFDVEHHFIHQYPFSTESSLIVSRQLAAIANIISAMDLPPKSSILEMGGGWGNTSMFLAQMGYKVTVLDINPKYGALLNKRSEANKINLDFECKSFDECSDLGKSFDCVLFFESFHHSYDHINLLKKVKKILNSGGILALAGEPILENLPFEWGINPAGEALWQIQKHGWFELVFKESYLLESLKRVGFSVRKYDCIDNPTGVTYICNPI